METLTYKVLLVDDEEEVMDVIEHKIDWEQCGFTVIGRAQNGLKALEIADRAYVLETGRIVTSGPADALMNDDSIKKAYLGE